MNLIKIVQIQTEREFLKLIEKSTIKSPIIDIFDSNLIMISFHPQNNIKI